MDEKKFEEMSDNIKNTFSKVMGQEITAEGSLSLALSLSKFVQYNDSFKNASLKDISRGIANFASSYISSHSEFMKMSEDAKAKFIGQFMEAIVAMFAITNMVDELGGFKEGRK